MLTSIHIFSTKKEFRERNGRNVDVWLQSRSLPARGRVDLEVHRCLCIIDAGNVFISTWHADFKHAATHQPRRKPAVETCVDNTAKLRPQASVLAPRAASANQLLKPVSTTLAKLRPQASVLAPRPCTCNAQRAAPRETACAPRSSTCVVPRASAWAPRSFTCDAQREAPRETAWAQR